MISRALLLGSTLVATPTAGREPIEIAIVCSPEGKLDTIQSGKQLPQKVGDPLDEDVIRRVLPSRRADVILTNSIETPYRCVGGLIYTLQRLGYRRIGFIGEPPPARP